MFKLSLVVLNNEYFIIKVNLICGFWFPLRAIDLQMYVLDNIPIDRISLLFGSVKLTRHYNFVILYAKYFIYSVKMKEGRLDINLFKHSLEQISCIENYIAIRKKTHSCYFLIDGEM